jgi:two-component system phosphate regulon sensor histidine kinase PhoR
MILEGYATTTKQKTAMLKIAYEHNNNQLDIINNLLKVAQAEANQVSVARKETDMSMLLQRVFQSQIAEYEKRSMKLVFEAPEEAVICSVDQLHLQMVFENLINNANKYSPPGSTVSVSLRGLTSEAVIRVKDQGIGIDTKDIPRLFKKFSRAENVNSTASGTGLGLYWAKKLVELHNGEISLKSTLGKGTTFTVKIPRHAPPPHQRIRHRSRKQDRSQG